MARFVKVDNKVYDANRIVSVSPLLKDSYYNRYSFTITFEKKTDKEDKVTIYGTSQEEYDDFVNTLINHQSDNEILQVQKTLMAEVAKLQKVVEDLMMAHAYVPGGDIAKKAEEHFTGENS